MHWGAERENVQRFTSLYRTAVLGVTEVDFFRPNYPALIFVACEDNMVKRASARRSESDWTKNVKFCKSEEIANSQPGCCGAVGSLQSKHSTCISLVCKLKY